MNADHLPCQRLFLCSRADLQDRYGPSRAYHCAAEKVAVVILGDGDDGELLGEVCRECQKNAANLEGSSRLAAKKR